MNDQDKNQNVVEIANKVNDHKMVLAVNKGECFWHNHPNSDELFLV